MKRKSLKLVALTAMTALTLSFAACGSSDNAKTTDAATADTAAVEDTAKTENETEAVEEPVAEEESSDQKTLEEYLKEDPTAEAELEEQAAAQGNDQMDMNVEVNGNELWCVATFKDSVDLPDDVAETLQEGMDGLGSTFSSLAGMLDDAIGAEKGTVSYGVRYCAPDGNVLAEASFSAQ